MTRRVTLIGMSFAVGVLCAGSAVAAESDRLMEGVKTGDAAAVRRLVEQRTNVNVSDADGTTALHWAVRRTMPISLTC
jgi:ankyrin repeat protein